VWIEQQMELRKYLRVMRQRWLLILVTIVACVAAGYVSAPKGSTYTAVSTLVVGSSSPGASTTAVNSLDRTLFTYAQLIDSAPVAEQAAQLAGIDRSADAIVDQTTAKPVDFTQLLRVSVTDEDPATAQALANGMTRAFVDQIGKGTVGGAGEGSVPEAPVYVYEEARLPTDPIEPPLASRLLVAAMFGFVAAIGLILLLEYLDVTVRTAADAERVLGLQVLGTLPLREDLPTEGARGRRRRRAAFGSDTARREALRILRTNVIVATNDQRRPVLLVTSAHPGEGKTSTCTELAVALARDGHRVVLVDADLRHPAAHRWIGGRNDQGLSDVLRQRKPLRQCLQYVEVGKGPERAGLYFLSTGPSTATPSELLGTDRMRSTLQALSKEADYVLIDTPPVLPVADTLVLGHLVTGAILVVASRSTPAPSVIKARDSLTRNQTRMVGVVVNKLDAEDLADDYGYGFEYGSS
jgi:capsular exopolysaccharide synthesis family protein